MNVLFLSPSSQSLNYHHMFSILGMEQKSLNVPEAGRYAVQPHSIKDLLNKGQEELQDFQVLSDAQIRSNADSCMPRAMGLQRDSYTLQCRNACPDSETDRRPCDPCERVVRPPKGSRPTG
uniref:Uncharacterized protein n=1 Tax=Molossus molossus TaxID=27622 RepID=A0A7J8FA03_MOLMO|nr:hypothetical protein HJG59_008518 [Molossus molossus]